MRDCLVELSLRAEKLTQISVCRRKIGLIPQRLLVLSDRLIETPRRAERERKIVVGARKVGFEPHGRLKLPYGLRRLSKFHEYGSEVVVREYVRRVGRE